MKQRTITFVFACLTIMTACGPNPYNIANMTVRELEVTSDSDLCLAAKSQWQTPQLMDEISQRNLNCKSSNLQHEPNPKNIETTDSERMNLEPKNKKSIHSIDFDNLTYDLRGTDCQDILHKSTITVHKGTYGDELIEAFWVLTKDIVYGDLTGDGEDEAAVIVACGGMHPLSHLLVFTINEDKVHRLFVFEPGDRGFGGILDNGVHINNQHLIVERMHGKAACCPELIEKRRFIWKGSAFIQVGEAERRKF